MTIPIAIGVRLWRHLSPDAVTGCWLWTGATFKGYGLIRSGGQGCPTHLAHRVSWRVHCGPIPEGLYVCHHCDNPPCCNPAHLFLGTQADNMRDCVSKGRQRHGDTGLAAKHAERRAQEYCVRGHALTAENCQPSALQRGNRECRKCHAIRHRAFLNRGGRAAVNARRGL